MDAAYTTHDDVLDRPQSRHFTSSAFVGLLLGATFLFYFLAPLASRLTGGDPDSSSRVVHYLIYAAAMHVALSAIFYVDPAMFALMRKNSLRFTVAAPLVFAGVCWYWVTADAAREAYFLIGYVVWTYWHFQKQHWGVYAFVRIHERSRPQPFDRLIVLGGGYLPVAIRGLTWIITENAAFFPAPVVRAAWLVAPFGAVLLGISLVAALYAVIREWNGSAGKRESIPVLSLVLLVFLSCNNWPFFLMADRSLATVMVNIGHGLQYLIFMTVFAYDRNRVYRLREDSRSEDSLPARVSRHFDPRWLGPVVGLLYVGVMLGGARWLFYGGSARLIASSLDAWTPMTRAQLGRVAQGVLWGITATHYVLDASAWKLTKPEPRAVMLKKFDFLLSRSARAAVPTI